MNSYLLILDQSFYHTPLANMILIIKELLSLNALLKMFFLLLSGVIILGKEKDFLNPLFLKLIIILIIKKLGIIPFSFRIIVINILGFLPLIKFMKLKICLYGLINGGSFLELKLVSYLPPFVTNY
jgi:hypothetical protein